MLPSSPHDRVRPRPERFLAPLVGALLFAAPLAAEAAPKAAIFPFELIDTSQEGELDGVRADQTRRLDLITNELRTLLAAQGGYPLVDLSGRAAEIDKAAPFNKCNGCEVDIAKATGAEIAVTGTVQKVSNLILNINIYVRDVGSGNMVKVMSADIRGNNDESWLRGLRWLVKNRFLDGVRP